MSNGDLLSINLADGQVSGRFTLPSGSRPLGNLLLHLAGSTRMWVVCGVGGENIVVGISSVLGEAVGVRERGIFHIEKLRALRATKPPTSSAYSPAAPSTQSIA